MTKEKHLKKEKKSKNGKASEQKGNLTDLELKQESCLWADEKAGKRKRKGKNVTECLGNATNNEEIIKTKKKKKKKQVGDYKVEAPLSKIQEGNKKKKKKKSECTDIEHAQIDEEEEEELPKKVKKKNKPGEQIKDQKNNTADKNTSDDTDEKPVPKKQKKSKMNLAENQETSEETGDVEGVKKNKLAPTPEDIKKTKEKKHGNTASLAEMNDVKKRKNKSAKSGDINVEEEKRKKKKAGKTPADVEETKLRKNKKSKQDKQDEELQSEESVNTRPDQKSRKRKGGAPTAEAPAEAPCPENGTKRKKKKKLKEEVEDQNELSQVDVAFVSVKNRNADQVTISQEGGPALETETDQASQPPKAANPSGLGQWSTAQFDSSETQQKFLRLMGGFKKGFQPSAGTTARANMALGKDGQQQLQQKLLDEFDRAHSRRMDSSNRGAGIGFTAPANKRFFIDVNASRSVRFDN